MKAILNSKKSDKIPDKRINKVDAKKDKRFTNKSKEDLFDLKKPKEDPDEEEVVIASGEFLLKAKRKKPPTPTKQNKKILEEESNIDQHKKTFVEQTNRFDKIKSKIKITKNR